jgi:adenylate cyclase
MELAPERKLTTILAADAVGYSAMMSRDEAGTLARLKAARATIEEEARRHRGRVVNTAGDALVAEFASVVNAVECAVRIQRTLAERHAELVEGERLRFRIGVNLGDVMVEGDDLFGDGVNIAARLQALAEPGGILISNTVFDQVRTKLPLGFDFLGPQTVKNIAEPVPAWRVVLGRDEAIARANEPVAAERTAAIGAADARGRSRRSPWERLRRSAMTTAVFIAFFFCLNVFTWSGTVWFHWPSLAFLIAFGLRAAWALGR